MAKSIISEGKTSTEAIENGLKQLGCKEEDVNIKILENKDKRAFFNILDPRIVKVELTFKENTNKNYTEKEKRVCSKEDIEESKKSLNKFLNEFTKIYGNINFSILEIDNRININIDGEDSSKLIGYRGETLNAMQTLLTSIANKNNDNRVKVYLNIDNYKVKREKALEELAVKISKTVLKNNKPITLEPMNAYERKIIHSKLQDNKNIKTHSIGEEPNRRIVIEKVNN